MAGVPSPDAIARVVRWAIILFFAYALWHSSFSTPKSPSTANTTSSGQTVVKEKDCNNNPLQNFPAFTMPLLPAVLPALHIEDTALGAGEPAQCGQTAKLRYEYATRRGAIIFSSMDTKAAPENIRIGSGDMLPGVEQGLIGMKPGGQRSITMPPILAFAAAKDVHTLRDNGHFKFPASLDITREVITAKASLLTLSPDVPSSPMPVRMIDTRFGNGMYAECGDTVTFDVTLWKLDGTKLFSTAANAAPLTFTIGGSQVPLGIEQGATGMMEGSERIVILPPAFAKPLDPEATPLKALGSLSWPEHEMVLVEMTRLSAVEKSAATPVKK